MVDIDEWISSYHAMPISLLDSYLEFSTKPPTGTLIIELERTPNRFGLSHILLTDIFLKMVLYYVSKET